MAKCSNPKCKCLNCNCGKNCKCDGKKCFCKNCGDKKK